MTPLIKGAIASAVNAAATLVIALPTVDPEHFSPWTWHGLLHLLEIIGSVVIVGEAQYWKQWAALVLGNKAS